MIEWTNSVIDAILIVGVASLLKSNGSKVKKNDYNNDKIKLTEDLGEIKGDIKGIKSYLEAIHGKEVK